MTSQPITDDERARLASEVRLAIESTFGAPRPHSEDVLGMDARITQAEKERDAAQEHDCRMSAMLVGVEAERDRLRAAMDTQHAALTAIGSRIHDDHGVWKIRRPHDGMPEVVELINGAMRMYHAVIGTDASTDGSIR